MKRLLFFISFISINFAIMAMSWRDFLCGPSVCLEAAHEAPLNQSDEEDNCSDNIYQTLAVIPEKIKFTPHAFRRDKSKF